MPPEWRKDGGADDEPTYVPARRPEQVNTTPDQLDLFSADYNKNGVNECSETPTTGYIIPESPEAYPQCNWLPSVEWSTCSRRKTMPRRQVSQGRTVSPGTASK